MNENDEIRSFDQKTIKAAAISFLTFFSSLSFLSCMIVFTIVFYSSLMDISLYVKVSLICIALIILVVTITFLVVFIRSAIELKRQYNEKKQRMMNK